MQVFFFFLRAFEFYCYNINTVYNKIIFIVKRKLINIFGLLFLLIFKHRPKKFNNSVFFGTRLHKGVLFEKLNNIQNVMKTEKENRMQIHYKCRISNRNKGNIRPEIPV